MKNRVAIIRVSGEHVGTYLNFRGTFSGNDYSELVVVDIVSGEIGLEFSLTDNGEHIFSVPMRDIRGVSPCFTRIWSGSPEVSVEYCEMESLDSVIRGDSAAAKVIR